MGTRPLSTYIGQSSITVTLDRYGHLFPGNEHTASTSVDAYLASAKGSQV
jgi:hypothetical protein